MTETTSFPTTKRIGTIGQIGRGVEAIVLRALDVDAGKFFNRWFTFEQVEKLGLLSVPIAQIIVPVEAVKLDAIYA